jgi:isopentenyl diphosphate isomerase/L-lactate dehydrogenase-like FMN-dependent dehydrogenase
VDGGIRRGTDVIRAIALGATAVLIGRPYLWALAVAGEKGVRDMLELLESEIRTAMALLGRPSVADLDESVLA